MSNETTGMLAARYQEAYRELQRANEANKRIYEKYRASQERVEEAKKDVHEAENRLRWHLQAAAEE